MLNKMNNSSKNQKIQKIQNKYGSLQNLKTISEEKPFYLCMKAQKVSASGLFKNDRVICVDNQTISYYSKVPQKCQYTQKEMSKQSPKIQFNHSELHSVEVNSSDQNMLIINAVGQINMSGKLYHHEAIKSFKFIFNNETELTKYKSIMEKIIENGKTFNKTASKEDQYISILHSY